MMISSTKAVMSETWKPYYDTAALKEFKQQVEYPIYYLDFETVMYGVPEFDESSPYQQIPFQYSIHVQKEKGSAHEHFEYLGDGVNDPRPKLIRQMLQHIDNTGSVMVYNATFEKTCIKKLAERFPEYAEELLAINERMVDLMTPFRMGWVEYPGFNGSYSIKAVLPVLVPELSYKNLDIQEGLTASFTYAQLKFQDEETQAEQRKQLLDYCCLDTFAMVKIFEKI